METVYLIIIVIGLAFLAGVYKVEEAHTKGEIRKTLNDDRFAFLSVKG